MSDFSGHSRAGIRTFFFALVLIIPILIWRESGETVAILKNLWKLPVCLMITYFSALFPDIDIKSTSQRMIYLLIFVLLIFLAVFHYYGWATGIGLVAVLGILFRHRGFLHTRFAAFLIPIPLLFIPLFINLAWQQMGIEFYLSAILGYLSHLKADELPSPAWVRPGLKKVRKRKNALLVQSTK